METKKFQIKGMHCASCSQVITKSLKKLKGVSLIDVNFATEKASISYDPDKVSIERINKEIGRLGYSLESNNLEENHLNHNLDTTEQLNKVYFSLPITLLVFILMMWDIAAKTIPSIPNLPMPMPLFNTIMFLLSSVMFLWVGKSYLNGIARFINYKVADMDTLIGIGTLTAFFYSSIIFLFPPVRELLRLPDHTYFDVTIVVIGFVSLGKYLETRSKAHTGKAIKKLLGLQAKTAIVRKKGKEIEIPISEVVVGDVVLVKAGTKIPVDGVVIEGKTSIDESMITGEPIPQDKRQDDTIIGGTLNKQGSITIKATQIGANTMLSQIIDLVEKAQGSKAKIQALADKISAVFVPTILLVASITLVLWLTVGSYYLGFSLAFSYGLLSFIGVLVIACPCALGLATPTAIIVGVGKGAENGILVKDAESLEKLYKINTLVFDKTGTITYGTPNVISFSSLSDKYKDLDILKIASSIEKYSQHPLAQAITNKAKELSLDSFSVKDFRETEGVGVEGLIHKQATTIRKPQGEENTIAQIKQLETEGKTVIVIEINKNAVGFIAISDLIKENARETIAKIHKFGIKTVMLTGDNQRAAQFIAQNAGIDNVKAQIMPQGKAKIIKNLQDSGDVVAMVGDGINDAPALTQANVGIAMATGTDIAIESSNITLLHGDVSKILQAIRLSRFTIRTVKQNLFWAFIYNVISIPLAAGLFYPIFGILLNPIFAGLAMAFSSISVVSNSLLLKKVKL